MKRHLAEFWLGWDPFFWDKRVHWDLRLLGAHLRLYWRCILRCITGCHTFKRRYPGSIGTCMVGGLVGLLACCFYSFDTPGCICACGLSNLVTYSGASHTISPS